MIVRKIKSIIAAVIIITSGLMIGAIFLTFNSSAASNTSTIPTHYYIQGYKGNKTIYLTKGIHSGINERHIPRREIAGNYSDAMNVNNIVYLAVGLNGTYGNGTNYSFTEFWSNGLGGVLIGIPILAVGADNWTLLPAEGGSQETNETAYSISESVKLAGLQNPIITEGNSFDNGFNVTRTNYVKDANEILADNYNYIYSFIPNEGYEISTINYLKSITNFATNLSQSSSGSGNSALTETDYITNGSLLNPLEGGIGQNVYGFSTLAFVLIPDTDFTDNGSINISTQNIVGATFPISATQPILTEGSSAQISFPTAPADTINGTVKVNGTRVVTYYDPFYNVPGLSSVNLTVTGLAQIILISVIYHFPGEKKLITSRVEVP